MHDKLLKNFVILILLINIFLLIKNDKSKSQKKFYFEMFGAYFENKEKFYAMGREYKMGRIGRPYNESNSITFQDKLNYLLIYESPEDKTQIVDKILLRNYSKVKLGKDICTPIIKIYDDVDEINLEELPDKFVLKCNHGSQMNIFCYDKFKFDLSKAKLELKKWIDINYGLLGFEYQYLNVKRRIFVEPLLDKEIINYKFSCFNGEPKLIRVKGNIKGRNLYNIYYINWTVSNIEIDSNNYILANIFKKPLNWEKMINYSKKLSDDFCYCRVDFYEVNGTLFLGEITFTPFNSKIKYKNKETEIYLLFKIFKLYLGKLINISKIKANKY